MRWVNVVIDSNVLVIAWLVFVQILDISEPADPGRINKGQMIHRMRARLCREVSCGECPLERQHDVGPSNFRHRLVFVSAPDEWVVSAVE